MQVHFSWGGGGCEFCDLFYGVLNQKLDQLLLLVGEQMSKTTEMKEEIATLKTDVMTIKKKQEGKSEISISKKKTPKLPTDLCVSCWSPCVCSVQHIQNFTVW